MGKKGTKKKIHRMYKKDFGEVGSYNFLLSIITVGGIKF